MSLLEIVPIWIREIPDLLKAQEICNEAVDIEPCSFVYVPDHLITQEIGNEAVRRESYSYGMFLITLRCRKCVTKQSRKFHGCWGCFPDRFKIQEICNKAVCMDPWLLKFVSDWLLLSNK